MQGVEFNRRHIGHDQEWEQLIAGKPNFVVVPVVKQVAELSFAEDYQRWWGEPYTEYEMNMESARELKTWASRVGGFKSILFVSKDRQAAGAVQNAILKTVEELSPDKMVIMVGRKFLPTIRSRAWVSQLGDLSDEHLDRVLLDEGFTDSEITEARGAGNIIKARQMIARADPVIVSCLTALVRRDRTMLDGALINLEQAHMDQLAHWVSEYYFPDSYSKTKAGQGLDAVGATDVEYTAIRKALLAPYLNNKNKLLYAMIILEKTDE